MDFFSIPNGLKQESKPDSSTKGQGQRVQRDSLCWTPALELDDLAVLEAELPKEPPCGSSSSQGREHISVMRQPSRHRKPHIKGSTPEISMWGFGS